MSFLHNLSIRSKLAFAFTIMIVVIALCGALGIYSATVIEKELAYTFANSMPAIDKLIEADRDLQQLLVAERSMIQAEPGSEVFKEQKAAYDENFGQSKDRWQDYTKLADTDEEKALIPEYDTARVAWEAQTAEVVRLANEGTSESRVAALELSPVTPGPASGRCANI